MYCLNKYAAFVSGHHLTNCLMNECVGVRILWYLGVLYDMIFLIKTWHFHLELLMTFLLVSRHYENILKDTSWFKNVKAIIQFSAQNIWGASCRDAMVLSVVGTVEHYYVVAYWLNPKQPSPTFLL